VSQPHPYLSGGVPAVGVRQEGVPEPACPPVRPAEQEPLAIGPPMQLAIVHALQGSHVDRSVDADDPYDPAHCAATPAGSPRWKVSRSSNRWAIIRQGRGSRTRSEERRVGKEW